LLHNLVNDLKLNQTVLYIILFLDLIYFFFKIDPNCTMNTPTPNFIKKLSWSSIYPLILRAVIIKGKKGPKGVGFLMQIWNGWECDQICLPWHARDRLYKSLATNGIFCSQNPNNLIVTQKPYHLLSLQSQYFFLFSPQFMSLILWIFTKKKKNTTM
jgi:hypothetical protein